VTLYRVFPFDASAVVKQPGGALYTPRSRGFWRIDNPDLYDVFYASDRPEGAVAETFGRYSVWRSEMFATAQGLPFALARYKTADDASWVDLDNARELVGLRLKPSDVVSRDRTKTQQWARRIYLSRRGIGVSWWSYYDPDVHTFGLWDVSGLTTDGEPTTLDLDDPYVVATAERINRNRVDG
jgi:hypothetical protein